MTLNFIQKGKESKAIAHQKKYEKIVSETRIDRNKAENERKKAREKEKEKEKRKKKER